MRLLLVPATCYTSLALLLSPVELRADAADLPGQAGKELKRLSIEELSRLEVTTVTREPAPAFGTAAAISVLDQEAIRRSGATSIPDLLRLVPGVNVAQIDSGKWAIGIRGFQGRLSRAVGVLIDGRSVYTPLFAGVYWEVQDTLLEDIDRIEVVRGPGATVWGSNVVNGVINIITKSAAETRGTLVSATAGTVEQARLKWRHGGGTDRFAYRVYGQGFTRGPQFHADNRDFDDWRMGQAGFRTDWAVNARDTLTFQGDAYGTIAGQKLVINRYSPPSSPAVEANGHYSGHNLAAVWRRTPASGSDFRLVSYYDRTDRQDLNYREIRSSFDADFVHHVRLGRHDVIWGAGGRISPSRFFQTVETVNFTPHEHTYRLLGSFVQDEISLARYRAALTLGLKLENNSFSGTEYQPSVRFTWKPNSRNTFWAAFTRAVRTPSRLEEGFAFSALLNPATPLYVRLVGDGQFSSEELRGYEIGHRVALSRGGIVAIAAFHGRYDDLLSVENQAPFVETDPPPRRLVLPLDLRNGVRATTSGVEIVSVWDASKWWRVHGSYSFLALDARRKPGSNDASTVRQLEGDTPGHKAVVRSSFDLPFRFEADLLWRHVSAVPNQGVPAYSTGDMRIGRRIGPGLQLSVVGRNLLQPHHAEYGGDPGGLVGIRRSAYLNLSWTR